MEQYLTWGSQEQFAAIAQREANAQDLEQSHPPHVELGTTQLHLLLLA